MIIMFGVPFTYDENRNINRQVKKITALTVVSSLFLCFLESIYESAELYCV